MRATMGVSRTLRVAIAAIALLPRDALAYRPFEQTDADVVEHHCVEVEFGPLALQRSRSDLVVVAPSLVLNYGLAPRVELVLEGRNELSLRSHEARRARPEDLALSLKAIVRSGSLQGDSGVSIAVEPSVLLPGVLSDEGIGTQIGVILSSR